VHVRVAAQVMGHDPAEYLRTYRHLYPGEVQAAAAALAAARDTALATRTRLAPVVPLPVLRDTES